MVLAGHPCPLACAEAPPADGPPSEASTGHLPPPSCPGGRGGPASPAPPSSSIGGIPPNLGHFWAQCRGHPLLPGTSGWWAAAVAAEASLTGPGEAGPHLPTSLQQQGIAGWRLQRPLLSDQQPAASLTSAGRVRASRVRSAYRNRSTSSRVVPAAPREPRAQGLSTRGGYRTSAQTGQLGLVFSCYDFATHRKLPDCFLTFFLELHLLIQSFP